MNPKSNETRLFLKSRPLRTAMHALWAIKKMNLEHLVPDLKHLIDSDFGWWEKYYPPGFEILPEYLKKHVRDRIAEELEEMSSPYTLEDINLFPN